MSDWDERVTALWAAFDEHDEDAFVAKVEALAAEREGSAEAAFERACAQDSTGHPDLAVPLYWEALALGVSGVRRRRTVIQLASSLRNLGKADESVELLEAELRQPPDELDDAVAGFLALALTDVGREREAVAIALGALAPHLPRYQRSLGNYARLIAEASP